MNERRPLWQRILERHKYPRRLLRPRVPLVLRQRRWGNNVERRTALQPHVTQYALNLHLQLSWPFVSVQGNTLYDYSYSSLRHIERGQAPLPDLFFAAALRGMNRSSHYSYSSLRNRERRQATLPDLFVPLSAAAKNKSGRGACPRSILHREVSLFRESRGFVLPQTQKLIQLLQQANSLTHISHNVSNAQSVTNESQVTNKNAEVQEARKIFAGMVLQHSNLATHITSRISSSSTRVDLQREVNDAPTITTMRSAPALPISAGILLATPPMDSKANANGPDALTKLILKERGQAPLPDLFFSSSTRVGTSQEGRLAPARRYTQPVTTVLPKVQSQAPLPDLFFSSSSQVGTSQEGRLAPARLYTQPVARNFVTQPAHDETGSQSPVRTVTSASPQTSTPTQQQSSLDIGRLTDEVYRHIQRKIRVERERRGL